MNALKGTIAGTLNFAIQKIARKDASFIPKVKLELPNLMETLEHLAMQFSVNNDFLFDFEVSNLTIF